MDNRQFLITSITLLYRESQQENTTSNSAGIVAPLVDAISLPDVAVGVIDSERELLTRLKLIVKEMCAAPTGHKYDYAEISQKVALTCKEETYLFSSFELGSKDPLNELDLSRTISGLRKTVKTYKDEKEITKLLGDAHRNMMFKRNEIPELSVFATNLMEALGNFRRIGGENDPAIVSAVDSTNPESFANVLERSQELNDPRGIMLTGWQALNNMMGGGVRRGQFLLTSALQHNFKTGSALSMFWHLPYFNTPWMIDEKKKPMMVRISFEDPLELNIPFLYRNIYENITGEKADLSVKAEGMAEYVIRQMSRNGYHIRMLHVNPSEWTYLDLLEYTNALEAQGFEIHVVMCDYLNMLPKTGLDNTGPTGANIRELFRRVRNHYAARQTTFITPHQLSTEAKMLVRGGMEEEFVKEIANKGYYDGCRTIDQEVDCEIHFHIVKLDGKSYLCIQRGKHRLVQQTDQKYLFTVLPFHDVGDVRVDLGGPDSSLRKPGYAPQGQAGGDAPFWAYDHTHMGPGANQGFQTTGPKSQVLISDPNDPSRGANSAKDNLPEKKPSVVITMPGHDLEITVGVGKNAPVEQPQETQPPFDFAGTAEPPILPPEEPGVQAMDGVEADVAQRTQDILDNIKRGIREGTDMSSELQSGQILPEKNDSMIVNSEIGAEEEEYEL